MNRLLGAVLLLVGLAYPFAVYFGMDRFSPRHFALLLGVLWLARALTGPQSPDKRVMTVAVLIFCAVLWFYQEPALLRWYPVLISVFMLSFFGLSLRYGRPLIERLARLREPELPPKAIAYTRQVTKVWCGFFLLNGMIAAALTLWAPLAWWTLYTGLIAYILMGALFAGEWLIRQKVRGHA